MGIEQPNNLVENDREQLETRLNKLEGLIKKWPEFYEKIKQKEGFSSRDLKDFFDGMQFAIEVHKEEADHIRRSLETTKTD